MGTEVIWSYGKETWEMTVVARGGEGGRGLREEKVTPGYRRETSEGHEGAEGQKLELRLQGLSPRQTGACHANTIQLTNTYVGEMVCSHFMDGTIEPWELLHHRQVVYWNLNPGSLRFWYPRS